MQRFYLEEIIIKNKIFYLTDTNIIHQLTKVLRIKTGEKIIFFNGKKAIDYLFIIKNIEKIYISFQLKDIIKKEINNKKINLYQAIPNKLSKIEYILQKGVEVGFNSFIFFSSSRSQKLILSESKIKRLEKIIIEAIEQSNQNKIPQLEFIKTLPNLNNSNVNLFFHTSFEKSIKLKDVNIPEAYNINIFVGPEGGWDEQEIISFEMLSYKKIFLGNNILRTETVSSVVGFYFNQKVFIFDI